MRIDIGGPVTTELPINIDETDAMTIAVVATDAFVSVHAQCAASATPEVKRGAVLLYEAIIRRIEEKLPTGPEVQYIHEAFARAKTTAALVRDVHGLPPVE